LFYKVLKKIIGIINLSQMYMTITKLPFVYVLYMTITKLPFMCVSYMFNVNFLYFKSINKGYA